MFAIIKDFGPRIAMKKEAVPFVGALVVAELLFKFGSFALECVAFLAVWCVFSFFQSLLISHGRERNLNS